jgi:hypothetical protein
MKILILVFLASGFAFSSEVQTDCPWMKQSDRRMNPKLKMETSRVVATKLKAPGAVTLQQ